MKKGRRRRGAADVERHRFDQARVIVLDVSDPGTEVAAKQAPGRIIAAALAQPSGFRPTVLDLFYQNNI